MTLSLGEYLLGLVLLTAMLGASAVATHLVVRRRLRHLTGSAMVTAYGLLLAAVVLAVHVIPLTLGIMSRVTVIVTALLAVALATRVPESAPAAGAEPPPAPPSGRVSWAAAAAAAGAVIALVIAFVADTATDEVVSVDALAFHLPHSAEWIHSGSLWSVESLVPGWAFGHYPNNGDVFQLVAILPWSNDVIVRFVSYPFALLAAVAIYAAARELGARRAAAVTFATLATAVPTALGIALHLAMTDTAMYATFAAGTLFAVRHARTGLRSDLILAALGLGLALGTKWYGLSSGVAVVAVWMAARLLARDRPAAVARDTVIVGAVMAAAGGVWLLRNLVLSGNPVFPVEVSLLGATIFDAPPDPIREAGGFALTDYATDPGLWERLIVPQLARSFGIGGALLLLAALAALFVSLRRRTRDGRVAAVGAAGLLCALVYAVTPYSAFGPEGQPILIASATRYGMPAIVLGATAAAWLAGRLGRAGVALELAGALLVAEAIGRYHAFNGLAGFTPIGLRDAVSGLAGLGLLVAAVLVARRVDWRRLAARRALMAGVIAAGSIVVVTAGYAHQRNYNESRYLGVHPAFDWLLRNAAADQRVGLAGIYPDDGYSPPWIAFGPRLENEVDYVGPVVRERRERHRSEDAFRDHLRRGDYDVVIVGLGRPGQEPGREAEWTATSGYTEVARSERIVVFRRG